MFLIFEIFSLDKNQFLVIIVEWLDLLFENRIEVTASGSLIIFFIQEINWRV